MKKKSEKASEVVLEEQEATTIVEETTDETSEKLSSDIQKFQAELDEQKNTILRVSAEFQNYKKRVEKEKADIYKFANEKLILEFLPVMDNFERALGVINSDENPTIKEGLEMIKKGFLDLLNKNGVEEIVSKDAKFDPVYHHAVMQEAHDDIESDTIIDVFQKGYTLNGKVIRPSMVKVSQ